MMKFFIFMDESGNNAEDQYFALGLLFVPVDYIGYVYDDMISFYDRAKDIAKNIKTIKIQEFIDKHNFDDLKKILSSSTHFELKFKNINFTNKDIYKGMIDKVCSYHNIQYATFVVDRSKRDNTQSYRDNYIKYASLGVSENMDNQHEYIFISDSITQPKKEKQIGKQFENYLTNSIKNHLSELGKRNDNFLGALRIESHSSVLLQLTDTILGCIMFYLRNQTRTISDKTALKKGFVAETLKRKLGNINFFTSQTIENPFIFSIKHY